MLVCGGGADKNEERGPAQAGVRVVCAPENIGSERLGIEQVAHGA